MKNLILLFIGLFLLSCSATTFGSDRSNKKRASGNNTSVESSIMVQTTPDLYAITTQWVKEYSKVNPEVKIEVIKVANPQDGSKVEADLLFVSLKDIEAMKDASHWRVIVGSDVIVPVISARNPFLTKINHQGISSEELATLFNHPEKQNWGTLLGNDLSAPVHYYRISDETVQSMAAEFLLADPAVMTGIRVENAKELIRSIQNDPYGIAFCRLTDIVAQGNTSLVNQVALLPVDKNRNGSLDQFENIYGSLSEFVRGVRIGKYPKGLSRTIYSVSPVKPSDNAGLVFLTWIITDGEQLLANTGNNDLAFSDRQAKRLEMLTDAPAQAEILTTTGIITTRLLGLSVFTFSIVILISIVTTLMIIEAVVRYRRKKAIWMSNSITPALILLNENSIEAPGGLYYDKSHTWAFMEQSGVVKIGIDDFLQHITGPLTRIKMKGRGEKVRKGEPIFSIIQNGKQLTINAPVSGTIKAQNDKLLTDTSMLNASPYKDGWVYMIEPANWAREIRFLFLGEKYREWLKTEFSRFKDFIAGSLKSNNVEYAQVILQDGGEVKDGVLSDLGPEVWEDFQTKFIDTHINTVN